MIKINGSNGFTALIDSDKVTAYGIDPQQDRRIWVICDGKEYASTVDVDDQFKVIDGQMKGFSFGNKVKGF